MVSAGGCGQGDTVVTDPTFHLNMMLIRMAKGAIKAWETWVRQSSGAIELPLTRDQMLASVRGDPRETETRTK